MMRILVADDDRIAQRKLQATIQKFGYEVVVASDGDQALAIMEGDNPPRVVVLDWEMPGCNGVDLCRKIRAMGDEPYTYVIMLTGRSQLEDVIEAMDAGADGFIRKPVEMAELKARLRPGLRMLDLQRQVIAAREAFRFQAQHDALTRLFNRRAILERLQNALHEHCPVSTLMVDIDHFKKINDGWGHDAGDGVLVEVARRLQSVLRGMDCVGRLGGEEFLVVLPKCNEENAPIVAERVRAVIVATPMEVPGGELRVTASIGVATTMGQSSPEALMKRSDIALYKAKHQGRNQVVFEPDELLQRMVG